MSQISKCLEESVRNIKSVAKEIKKGRTLSMEDAELLLDLIEMSGKLRNSAIWHDHHSKYTNKQLAKKYSLSTSRISQIANIPMDDAEQRQLMLNF